MNDILVSLNQINGVIGSAVFGQDNECIAHAIPAPYEPILLSQLLGELKTSLEFLGSVEEGKEWGSLHLWLDEGCLVLRNVEKLSVLVVGSPAINLSMLGVGLNVAGLKLSKAQAGGGNAPMGVSRSSSSSVAVSSLTPTSASSSGRARVPNAVGSGVVDALLKTFAKQIGPFAKIALKEEMARLGVTPSTLVPAQFEDLVTILAARLTDPAKQKQFVAEARSHLPAR
jgi:hypothetical protein